MSCATFASNISRASAVAAHRYSARTRTQRRESGRVVPQLSNALPVGLRADTRKPAGARTGNNVYASYETITARERLHRPRLFSRRAFSASYQRETSPFRLESGVRFPRNITC